MSLKQVARRLNLWLFVLLAGLTFTPATHAQAAPPIPAQHIRIHYFRQDTMYTGWTVYAFSDTTTFQADLLP